MSPHRRPVPIWYAVLVVLVSVLAVSGAGIWYTHREQAEADRRWQQSQREADRRWCELLDVLGDRSPPPETDRGARIAEEVADLSVTLGCPP